MTEKNYLYESDESLDKLESAIEKMELSENEMNDFSNDPVTYFKKNSIQDLQCNLGEKSLLFSDVVLEAEVPGRVSMARTLVRRMRASEPTMSVKPDAIFAAANAWAFANVGYAVNLIAQANAIVNTNINNMRINSRQDKSQHLMVDLAGRYKESNVFQRLDALGYSSVRQAAIIKSLIVSSEPNLTEGMHKIDSEWNGINFVLEFECRDDHTSVCDAYLVDAA